MSMLPEHCAVPAVHEPPELLDEVAPVELLDAAELLELPAGFAPLLDVAALLDEVVPVLDELLVAVLLEEGAPP